MTCPNCRCVVPSTAQVCSYCGCGLPGDVTVQKNTYNYLTSRYYYGDGYSEYPLPGRADSRGARGALQSFELDNNTMLLIMAAMNSALLLLLLGMLLLL